MDSSSTSLRRMFLFDYSVFPKTTVRIVPGPGNYNNQEALDNRPNGYYHLSNHRSTKAKVWNPPRSQRFYKSSINIITKPPMHLAQESMNLETIFRMKESMFCPKMFQLVNVSSWMEEDYLLQILVPRDRSVFILLVSSWTR